jgi:uncharacterized protein YjiS (DUF1127 family)
MVMSWLLGKLKQIAAKERLRAIMSQMSERELKDIGLSHCDIDRIIQGLEPPFARPPDRNGVS